jgi:hypothetical protein
VLPEAHGARAVRGEVLRLGAQLAVGAGEEQLVGDEQVERAHVGGELRRADARLERDDLGVGRADQHGLHRGGVGVAHGRSMIVR